MPPASEYLFYDGSCGLCHRSVRFTIRHGPIPGLRYAPLGGPTFLERISEAERRELPNSLVLLTSDGRLLVRSAATLHLARRLGNPWHTLGAIASIVPAALLDALYDRVAAVRHRLFAPPADACPVVPAHLRDRFDP
jgi:predicted DCC family thiol-disulfide oxidoreductase YuxK